MKKTLVIFLLVLSYTSYGALTKECANNLYDKYHANEHKEVMKQYELQFSCFGSKFDKATLPIVPTSPARMAPQTISSNSPFKDLIALKPQSKDWMRLYYFLRYPDFRASPGTFNEEKGTWNPDVAKNVQFPKKAYDCAMANARKANEELLKFYTSIVQEANTNCGQEAPIKSEAQLKKEMETFWYNVINYNYKNDGQEAIYPFSFAEYSETPKGKDQNGMEYSEYKISVTKRFEDVDGKLVALEPQIFEGKCKNTNQSWGQQMEQCQSLRIDGESSKYGASMAYYKGMKTIAMPSSPVAEKKEAKSSTEVQLVKTGAKTAEIRAYENLYYDNNGNLSKGVPTSVTPVQCDGEGVSCADVLKDFEKTYAKTPSYIVDEATAMNTLLYEKPASSQQSASGSNTSSATGTTQIPAAPVKTALPSKAPEVELIDNGDGTAKLMFFNDFYYNQNGELVRSQASQVTVVQCGNNKSVTCDQVLSDAKNAMKDKTGYLVTESNASANSVVAASNLTDILSQAASKAQTSLTCGQNDLVAMGTSLQQEIEAVKKRANEEIEKINGKYKQMAQDKGCNLPGQSSSTNQIKTKESNSLEKVMGAF